MQYFEHYKKLISFRKIYFLYSIFFILSFNAFSQTKASFFQKSDTLNKSRRNAVYITEASVATITLIGLNQLWYADYPR